MQRWLAADPALTILASIKFQGATDHATARAFAAWPGARLFHLWHNKHELTLYRPGAAVGDGAGGLKT